MTGQERMIKNGPGRGTWRSPLPGSVSIARSMMRNRTRKNGIRLLVVMAGMLTVVGCSSSKPATETAPPPSGQSQRTTPLVVPNRGRQDVEAGATVEIRKPWTTIRATPSTNGKAMGLAYGNDTFTVVSVEGDWVQVQVKGKKNGWIPKEATED